MTNRAKRKGKTNPLRRYRERCGWEQVDVAMRLDVVRGYISDIERLPDRLAHEDTRRRVAEKGYLLPLGVFDALRKGRIGVEKALMSSLDQKHRATECGAENAA